MSKLEQAQHPFEKALSVCSENLQDVLHNFPVLPWLDFWLNPRRLRGSDFLMRWSQGVWSEHRLIEAVWHVFYDRAYGLSFDRAEKLIKDNLTEATVQTFQAPGGATTKKIIYKHYYHYGYALGVSTEDPKLLPAFVEDKNGHILPYVTFCGGHLSLSTEALEQLRLLAAKQK